MVHFSETHTEQAVRDRLALLQQVDLCSLWASLVRDFPDEDGARGPRGRKRPLEEEGAPVPGATLSHIQQLVGDVACGKVLQFLNSEGSHDPREPEV